MEKPHKSLPSGDDGFMDWFTPRIPYQTPESWKDVHRDSFMWPFMPLAWLFFEGAIFWITVAIVGPLCGAWMLANAAFRGELGNLLLSWKNSLVSMWSTVKFIVIFVACVMIGFYLLGVCVNGYKYIHSVWTRGKIALEKDRERD